MTREEAKLLLIRPTVSSNVMSETKAREIEAYNMAIEALSERTGEWIDVNGDGSLWKCDQCNDTACCMGNFCPNCGAVMTRHAEPWRSEAEEEYVENTIREASSGKD